MMKDAIPFDRRGFLTGSAAAVGAAALLPQQPASAAAAPSKPGKTPNTKFAVNVEMWWTNKPFLDRVKAAIDFGFPAIEFWPWKNKDLAKLADLCRSNNMAVAQFTAWGFAPGLNETKNHKDFVKAIEDGCKVAKDLDCKMMTVVGGNDVAGMSQQDMHANIITGLKLAAPIAEANGVMLILEPMNIRVDHKGHCLYGSVPAVNICRAVNSPMVKINWDLYHMHITEGDLCRRLKEGYDQVGYIQVADNPGRNEPGTGEIFYARVYRELKALGYTGYVGLECRPKEGEEKAAERIWASDQW